MEWPRELSSSQTAYGVRKGYNEVGDHVKINISKKHPCKRDEDVLKPPESSDERNEQPVANLHAKSRETKIKQQQQQLRCSENNSFQRDYDVETKGGQGKDFSDPTSTESSPIRICKQQCSQDRGSFHKQEKQQPALNQSLSSRRQQQMSIVVKENIEEEVSYLKSCRTKEQQASPVPDHPAKRGSKRSKRMAQRLLHEGPLPPPLKLPRLHLVLTRKEIQEDWIKITGHKYSGKPRKSVLAQLGLGLCSSLTCPSSIRYLNSH